VGGTLGPDGLSKNWIVYFIVDHIADASYYATFFIRPTTGRKGRMTPTGRLLSTLLAAIAEFERELIRERAGEGRKRAKARGVRFGRPSARSAIFG
jgi:Resolvase, N terminal domain